MRNILVFSCCVLFLMSCDGILMKFAFREPKPASLERDGATQNEMLSKRVEALQKIVDRLDQTEAEMQKLFDRVNREQKIPQSNWIGIDKEDISKNWQDVKERFSTFRQIVKDYYGLLQEELKQPSEILSVLQIKRTEGIAEVFELWPTYLALLDRSISELGEDYSKAHEKHQLQEIMTVWKELYKNWEAFSKELKDYQI